MKLLKLNTPPTGSHHYMTEALKKVWQAAYLSENGGRSKSEILGSSPFKKVFGNKKSKPS
jgi:hypothetical protein